MDYLKKTISTKIRILLEENNKKQKELAQYLNVTDNTISYYCSGKRTPNLEQIKKIAIFFNTTADFLIGLTNVKSVETDMKSICDYTGLAEDAVNIITRTEKKHPELIECLNIFICNDNLPQLLKAVNDYAFHYSMNSAHRRKALIEFAKDRNLNIESAHIEERGIHALDEQQKLDFEVYEIKHNLKNHIVYDDTDYDVYKAQKELARCLDEGISEVFNPECRYYIDYPPNTEKIYSLNPFIINSVVNHIIDVEKEDGVNDNGNDNEEK